MKPVEPRDSFKEPPPPMFRNELTPEEFAAEQKRIQAATVAAGVTSRPVAKDPAHPTAAELKAQADWDAASFRHPVLSPERPVFKDPEHPTTAELKAQADWDSKHADADAARAKAVARNPIVVDDRLVVLMHNIDGRTTVIARELEHDAAVLEQLRAQMQLDQRDLRLVTTAQLEVLTVVVARTRAYAAQLVALCASRDVPLPIPPTLPAAPSVPPSRA